MKFEDNSNIQIFNSNRINDDYKKYYEIYDKIGRGAFGYVYKVKDKKTNELRAMKIIDFYEDEEYMSINNFINELKIMEICNKSKNSVKLYEYFQSKKEFVYIIELCDGDLEHLLKNRKEGFNAKEIYNIMTQLNNIFRILKENKIVHRDIKLSNILIKYEDCQKKNFIVKLNDYAISKQMINTKLLTHCGTSYIMAPEIIEGKEYDYKCDLWSIGVMIYQMCFNEYPYEGTELLLLNQIKRLSI